MIKKILKRFFRNKTIIPSYEEKRYIILSYKKKYQASVFVETGTFLGDTIQSLSAEFDQLYSIELSEELAKKAQKRFSDNEHIKIIQGSSDTVLEDLLNNLSVQSII